MYIKGKGFYYRKKWPKKRKKYINKRRNYHIKESYLNSTLIDKFKLYKHKYKKAEYIPGFYSDIEYVPPIINLKGFKRK